MAIFNSYVSHYQRVTDRSQVLPLAVKEPKDAIEVQWQKDQRRQTVNQRQEGKPRPNDCHWISAETGAGWKMLEVYLELLPYIPISSHIHITVDSPAGQMHGSQIPRTTVPSVSSVPGHGLWSWWCSESVWNQSTHFRHIIGCIQCLAPTTQAMAWFWFRLSAKKQRSDVVNGVSSQGTRWAWAPSEWQFRGSCCQCSLRCFSAGGY